MWRRIRISRAPPPRGAGFSPRKSRECECAVLTTGRRATHHFDHPAHEFLAHRSRSPTLACRDGVTVEALPRLEVLAAAAARRQTVLLDIA